MLESRNLPIVDVRKLRSGLGMSQSQFAARFCLSVGALRDWEQRRRWPDRAARVLLLLIERSPDAVTTTIEEALEELSRRRA